ncbi:MAG: hypothetical protein N2C14_24225, partial [Planctomycetales bacterium]
MHLGRIIHRESEVLDGSSAKGARSLVSAALLLVALSAMGCAGLDMAPLDASVPVQINPGRPAAIGGSTLNISMSPRKVVAPVGSEVVLAAGIHGCDGLLLPGERVDWLLAQGGVGEFVSQGVGGGLFSASRKVDNQYVVGETSRRVLLLHRGNANPADDVTVLRGQAWVSVTSAVEGTSHVTAFAPGVCAWEHRKDTAQVHWVDAEWAFPPPAVAAAGTRHRFTTTVTRHSNHGPVAGWIVRYEIVGGPAARFAPGGEQAVEVPTDASGQATAEILPSSSEGGTTAIRIQVIRPADAAGGGERVVLG